MADVERPSAVRPFWSGVVTFGLVSIPVDLFAAVRSNRVSLRQIGPDGKPLSRRYVNAERETPLDNRQIVRGFEVEPGRFVTVTDEELEALEPSKTREIDLRRFVSRDEIDPIFCDKPYFLLPQGEVTKAYRLLARTMEETARVGVASFVMRDREYLVAILAERGILRAETLRHADEVRSAETVGLPDPIEVPPARVKALRGAIDGLLADEIDIAELSDRRAAALRALGEKKAKQDVVRLPERAAREEENIVDIMQILRERLGAPPPTEQPASSENRPSSAAREDLSSLTKKELYERAQERDVPGRSKMTREELIEALT